VHAECRHAVVRTTHMTGVVTDIGVVVGHMIARWLRRLIRVRLKVPERESSAGHKAASDDWMQLKLLSLLFVSFFTGSFAGMHMFHAAGSNSLLLPAIAEGVTGLGYFIFRLCLKTRWTSRSPE
jgi:hypothetical protein